jgi:adenylyltransferase/sulfurtransferase
VGTEPSGVITEAAEDTNFVAQAVQDTEGEFARERLLDGWDAGRIARARVMVVGAGALGNEVLKNLALLGFRHLFIVDMDMVAPSNLSRSLLFSRRDQGRSKAEVAARQARRLCLAQRPQVRAYPGDLTLDLGSGVYRRLDVVIGCLDNVAARRATDSGCWLFGVPWVEGGIAGYQGSVTLFVPPDGPCYLCTLSAADYTRERERYSCDQRRLRAALTHQIPAIQTVSAVVAATQVQETLKLLQGQDEPRTIFYDGLTNQMSQSTVSRLANHAGHHPSLVGRTVREEPRLSATLPLADALRLLGDVLDCSDISIRLDHPFVTAAVCAHCGHAEPVLRSLPRVWADEYQTCPRCGSAGVPTASGLIEQRAAQAVQLTMHRDLSPDSPAALQALSLHQLGVPLLHVIQARTPTATHYIELTGDLSAVLGTWG